MFIIPKNLKQFPRVIFIAYAISFGLGNSLVNAQEVTGEIINVNYKENVAFIDLGKDSLNKGDVLSIEVETKPVYLEAVEVNDAVSKIAASTNASYPFDAVLFKDVMVGGHVKRVWVNKPAEPAAAPIAEISAAKAEELAKLNEELNQQLVKAKVESASIVLERDDYKKKSEELQIKVDQLKQQLDSLVTTIDEQINHVSK